MELKRSEQGERGRREGGQINDSEGFLAFVETLKTDRSKACRSVPTQSPVPRPKNPKDPSLNNDPSLSNEPSLNNERLSTMIRRARIFF